MDNRLDEAVVGGVNGMSNDGLCRIWTRSDGRIKSCGPFTCRPKPENINSLTPNVNQLLTTLVLDQLWVNPRLWGLVLEL